MERQSIFQVNTTLLALFLLANIFIGVTSSGDDGVPSNPCAAVLCITNTTCIAVPDINDCEPNPYMDPPCPMKAMCIPNNVQLPDPNNGDSNQEYCGTQEEKCDPGYKCGLVYLFCPVDVKPCLPVVGCIPDSSQQNFKIKV